MFQVLVTRLLICYFDRLLTPMPIQIQPWHVATWHAMDNSIRVDHWNYYELEWLKEVLANLVNLVEEIANKVLSYEGTRSLAGVLSR